jgi:hypothetical protein
LVRHDYLRRAEPRAWALYLFLLTVADVNGLSYYSDTAIARHLNLEASALAAAREQLVQADLIAYQKPLCQVLALPEDHRMVVTSGAPRSGQMQSVGDILRRALDGGVA